MKNPALPLIALLVGVITFVSSYVVAGLGGGASGAWTAEDEAAYSAATEKWRSLGHSHGPRDDISEAEATRITQEFEQQRQKFSSASSRGKVLAAILWWGGLLLSFGGAAGVFILRLGEM